MKLAQRTRRNMSDPRIKRMVNAQENPNRSKPGRNGSNNASAVAFLKVLVLLAIIVSGIAVLVYPNQEVVSEIWRSAFHSNKTAVLQNDTAALPAKTPGELNLEAETVASENGDTSEQSTENTQSPQPVERGIQVEVLNGCGVSGLADRITKFLRKQDIDVVSTGNFDNFDVLTTRILDRSDNHERAEKVAEALGLSKDRILLRKDINLQLDVTIVLGADYKSLEPLK